ncbi:OPT oligopeptide transporter [Fimicolochytrium jonesii]|uniref:OPT oligopeptide transporter n=1 Tax=Fimicolochytrium jonesii TaxID=1396493 RepID=UPI0022FEBFF8|nr:OPT oligopeptide transporter [Fimicolochytrium jonesii]KAI8815670.1 OPT oligopeptide transporter [Fimicolochytrium jonesii]
MVHEDDRIHPDGHPPQEPATFEEVKKNLEVQVNYEGVDAEKKENPDLAQPEVVHPTDEKKGFHDGESATADFEALHHGESDPDDLWSFLPMLKKTIPIDKHPNAPIVTWRSIFLGLALSVFGAVLGQIFQFKPQTLTISSMFVAVISFIFGKSFERFGAAVKRRYPGAPNWIDPGVFSLKEHAMVVVMARTASSSAFATDLLAAMHMFYDVPVPVGQSLLLLLSTQLLGYGLAGLFRSFLVEPKYLYYPDRLPDVALFGTLHKSDITAGKGIRFFWMVFGAIFVWTWFPQYIMPWIAGVSVFCLAAPNSSFVTRLFGGASNNEGLGLLSLSFDWNAISVYSPLWYPLETQLNMYIGLIICWFIFMGGFYSNLWGGRNLPFMGQDLFYANGTVYDQSLILDENYHLIEEKVAEVGTPYYTTTYALYLVGANLGITASITHVALYYGKTIWHAMKAHSGTDEYVAKVKREHGDVPLWQYLTLFAAAFIAGLVLVYTTETGLSWWSYILAILIGCVLTIVIGIFLGATGFGVPTQGLVQLIAGYVIPGSPVANMYFSTYGYLVPKQARSLLADLKFSAYLNIPFQQMFYWQTAGAVIGCICNYAIQVQILNTKMEILRDPEGSNLWSGQGPQGFNAESVTWGAFTSYLYAPGKLYFPIAYAFLIGFALPVPFWLLHKKFPTHGWNRINTGIICWFIGNLCVGVNTGTTMMMIIAFVTQFYVRKYHNDWFSKHNYLLSAGLDAGTQVQVLVQTFTVAGVSGTEYPFPNWWGNPSKKLDGLFVDRCGTNALGE